MNEDVQITDLTGTLNFVLNYFINNSIFITNLPKIIQTFSSKTEAKSLVF